MSGSKVKLDKKVPLSSPPISSSPLLRRLKGIDFGYEEDMLADKTFDTASMEYSAVAI